MPWCKERFDSCLKFHNQLSPLDFIPLSLYINFWSIIWTHNSLFVSRLASHRLSFTRMDVHKYLHKLDGSCKSRLVNLRMICLPPRIWDAKKIYLDRLNQLYRHVRVELMLARSFSMWTWGNIASPSPVFSMYNEVTARTYQHCLEDEFLHQVIDWGRSVNLWPQDGIQNLFSLGSHSSISCLKGDKKDRKMKVLDQSLLN